MPVRNTTTAGALSRSSSLASSVLIIVQFTLGSPNQGSLVDRLKNLGTVVPPQGPGVITILALVGIIRRAGRLINPTPLLPTISNSWERGPRNFPYFRHTHFGRYRCSSSCPLHGMDPPRRPAAFPSAGSFGHGGKLFRIFVAAAERPALTTAS